MGAERVDMCRQDSCTLRWMALQICGSLVVSSQTGTQHRQQPCRKGLLMQKGWAGIQLWLKKPLLAILDEQRKWPTCCCFCILEEAALPSPDGNGSWNHWCCTRSRMQHSSLSHMCWEVCLISYWLYSQFKDSNIPNANIWPLVLCANELQMELQLPSALEQLVLHLNSSEANAFFIETNELRQSHGSSLGLKDVACVMAPVAHDFFW